MKEKTKNEERNKKGRNKKMADDKLKKIIEYRVSKLGTINY